MSTPLRVLSGGLSTVVLPVKIAKNREIFFFYQSGNNDFNTYEYMKIGNRNIAVEVGSDSEGNIPDINSLPDF